MILTPDFLELEEKIKARVEELKPLRDRLENEMAAHVVNEETKNAIYEVMSRLDALYKERSRLFEQLKNSQTTKGE